ncbi:MAG: hypothetical protein GY756_06430 [bacterium]|nr:hypothetical protein [bacterium]
MKNIFPLITFLFLTGCSLFNNQTNTTFFDISTPDTENTNNLGLTIKPVKSDLPFGKKMAFITSKYSMTCDSYNKWSKPPEELVTQYFELYFNNPEKQLNNKTDNKYTLEVQIIRFACYSTKPEILLQMNIKVNNKKSKKTLLNKSFIQNIKFNKLTADSFAEAMSKGVNNICSELKTKLLELNKKSN